MQTLENHSYTLQNRRKKTGFTNDEKDDRGNGKGIVKTAQLPKITRNGGNSKELRRVKKTSYKKIYHLRIMQKF